MPIVRLIACVFVLGFIPCVAAPTFSGPTTNGTINISGLSEASGIVASHNNDSVLWTHNDSGHPADVYAIDTQGRLLGTYGIPGNTDNEDIAIGPGPVTNISYLYIGDIGDNGLSRAHIKVYQIPEPAVYSRDFTNPVTVASIKGARTITLTYPDQTNNAEAMFVDPQTGDLWIITKDASPVRIYKASKSELDTNNSITLTFVQTLAFDFPNAADITQVGNEIVVRQENFGKLWMRTNGQSISSAFLTTPVSIPVPTTTIEPNGEAIGFDQFSSGYFTVSDSAATQPLRYYTRTSYDAPQRPVTLINSGADWKYLDTGTDQGTAWRATNFNDSTWSTGTAQFGYGDGDEKTVVSYGPNASAKYITTYFRKTFVATNVASMQAATLKMVIGHGAIVYLNGNPVVYEGLTSGATYTTLAPAMTTSLQSAWHSYIIAPTLLTEGTNTLAVEVHQYSLSGTNMSFDLQLSATAPAIYEPFNYAVNTTMVNVTNSSGNWWTAAGSGASSSPKTVAGNLPVSGLQLYKGNSVQFGAVEGPSGRFNIITNVTAGTLYYSLAFKATDLGTLNASGGVTAGFNNSRGTQTPTPSVLATKILTRATTGGYNIGTAKNSSTATDFVWAPNVFTTNDTVFIVGSYRFNTGSTTDDVSTMWINPDPATFGKDTAPAATLVATTGSDIGSAQIASFVLLQRGNQSTNNLQPGTMIVDELRMGFSWADVTPVGPTVPIITTQPQSQTVNYSSNAIFNVVATSGLAMSYQWRFNGASVPNATQSSYTRTSITAADAGTYSIVVTNLVGATTSSNATLIVNGGPPVILTQPASQTISALNDAIFTVSATGALPLSYQWRLNGVSITGATQASYTRGSVTSSRDGGSYSVVVSNSVSTSTSSTATLTVVNELNKGTRLLMLKGPQLQGMVTDGDVFHLNTYSNAHFTSINWLWNSVPSEMGTAPGYPWSRWAQFETNIPPTTAEIPYTNNLVAIQLGDEWNLNDDTTRTRLVNWFTSVKNAWPNTILYHNNYGGQVGDTQLGDFISRAQPDMISFDSYPFKADCTSGNAYSGISPTSWYGDLRRYRQWGFNMGIPLATYMQTFHASECPGNLYRDPSASELRFNNFAALAFNAKTLTGFTYNTGASSLFIPPGGDTTPSSLYAEQQNVNLRALDLGKALVCLTPVYDLHNPNDSNPPAGPASGVSFFPDGTTTGILILKGNPGTGNATPTPIGFADDPDAPTSYTWWEQGKNDPYLTGWTVTNLGSVNSGQPGEVLISWFRPIDETLDGPNYNNEIYMMVVNALTATNGAASTCLQEIKLNFNGLAAVDMLDALTGIVTTTNLPIVNTRNQLTLDLNGGDAALFKFSDGAPFVGKIAPTILTQPTSQSIGAGTNATFTVTANGMGPLSYQWRLNNSSIAGATLSSYTRANIGNGDAGSYSVIVTNSAGTVTSTNATLTIATPPSITAQPQNTTSIVGSNATFSVTATGTAPLNYQWRFNGGAISGTSASSYTRSNLSASDAGSYSVVITNVAGTVTSANAILVVNTPPTINSGPTSQTVAVGSNVVFSVSALGTTPLTYQWRFNNSPLTGANTSTYTRNNAQLSDAGSYTVVVTNIAGTATSSPAILTVFTPGQIRLLDMTSNADSSISMVWSTDSNLDYALQFKSNLLDAQWTFLSLFTAQSNSLSVSDTPGNATQRFYQLSSAYGTSSPAGFLKLNLLGNSDTFVSTPFARPGSTLAVIGAISSNVITVTGSPNWSVGQFVYSSGSQSNTFCTRFCSGPTEGRVYRVTNNTANTVTVDLGSDTTIEATAGDLIAIEPYWTLATLFPNGNGVNVSPTPGNRNTELLLPDTVNPGINLSATKVYYFNSGFWKQVGQGSVNYNDDIIAPNSYFIIRHNVSTNTVLMSFGSVLTNKVAISLQSGTTNKQDNAIAIMRPLPVSLDASGLVSSGAFSASPLPGSRTDELLTFDNNTTNRNKSAAAVYYYWSGAWRQVGAGTSNVGTNQPLGAGTAAIIRKGTNGSPVIWTNSPNY